MFKFKVALSEHSLRGSAALKILSLILTMLQL